MFSKLLGLSYKIVYHQGTDNRVADALSRYPGGAYSAISVVQPTWLEFVVASYSQDAHAQSVVTKLSLDPNAVHHFTLSDGILRYKSCIWVGSNTELQHQLIQACHTSAVGGHSGVPVTLRRFKQLFAWHGM